MDTADLTKPWTVDKVVDLLSLLVTFHLVDTQSQTYAILSFFADGTFAFLPMLLAYTTAKKMKCNVILAMGTAAIMLHSSWGAMVAAGEAVHFFGVIPFRLVSYTSSVIPIILVILVQAVVEKWLDRIIPKSVNLVFVALLISAVATAVVTFLLSLKFEKAEPAGETKSSPAFDVPANTVAAPVEGAVVPMEEIPDETFSAGVLGQGLGIQPIKGEVVAPFSGTVTQVADTGHAIGLASQDGLELLIHVGVDTVEMNGTGFTPKVKEGDTVRAGQLLLTFDRKAIAGAGHPDVVVIMLTNADDYGTVTCAPAGDVKPGARIIHAEN